MAKRRRTRTRTSTKIVRVPSASKPIVIRQSAPLARRSSSRRRYHTSGVGSGAAALLNNERTGAMVGAAVLGLLDKQGTKLPTVPFLGRAGTAGIVTWWFAKNNRSPQLNHAATGLLSIAVYELMKEGHISGAELDGVATV